MDIFGEEIDDTTLVRARVKVDPHVIEIDFIRATEGSLSHAVTTLKIDGVVDFQFLSKGQGARGVIMSWADGVDATGFAKHRGLWLKSLDFSFPGFHVRDRGIPVRQFSLHTTSMLLKAHYFGPATWSYNTAAETRSREELLRSHSAGESTIRDEWRDAMTREAIIDIHGEEIVEDNTGMTATVDLDNRVVEILFMDSLDHRPGEDRVRILKLENVVEAHCRGDGLPMEERWGSFLGWGEEQELTSYAIARASQVAGLDQRLSSEPWVSGPVMKCFFESTEMLIDLHYLGPVTWTERWQPNSD